MQREEPKATGQPSADSQANFPPVHDTVSVIEGLRKKAALVGANDPTAAARCASKPRVLVDTCARQHGVLLTHEIEVPSTAMWGDTAVAWKAPYLQGRQLKPADSWLREQIENLASVTAAMKTGRLEAYTTESLQIEGPDKLTWADGSRGDLWRDVTFEHVNPPLERSTLMGSLNLDQYFSGDHQQEFCKLLLDLERAGRSKAWIDALELDDFQRANVARLGDYRTLCKAVGEAHWRDAFHLWAAICSDLEYFLTTDRTFLRLVREGCENIEHHLRAVSPSELVDVLDLPRVPLPIREGELITLFDALAD